MHKALTPKTGAPDMTPAFNIKAKHVRETEIKFLVPRKPDDSVDRSVFDQIERFFAGKNWIRSSDSKMLLTRQLDTPDRALYKKGVTLRIRGECEDGDIKTVNTPDICVKTGKTRLENGAVDRGEYEARIRDFQHIDLKPLYDYYPQDEFPEIHNALANVKAKDLREFFRIDCIRTRHLIDLPDHVSGLPGKRFVGELLLDDVAYVLDLPGLEHPLVFHHDQEVEMEMMFKPCDYDTNPDAANHVCSPDLTEDEAQRGLAAAIRTIQQASGNTLLTNGDSKAERGFMALDKVMGPLQKYLQTNKSLPKKSKIHAAFRANPASNDNHSLEKIHYHLPCDFGPILRKRPIASSSINRAP